MYSGKQLHRSHCHNCIVPSLKRSPGLHFHPAIMGLRAIAPAALLAQRPKWKSKWIQIVSLYKKMWLQRNKIQCPILLFHNNRMLTVVGPPSRLNFIVSTKNRCHNGVQFSPLLCSVTPRVPQWVFLLEDGSINLCEQLRYEGSFPPLVRKWIHLCPWSCKWVYIF